MIFPLLSFIFGLIIGSFLNVVIFRLYKGESVEGRSKCLSCGKTLKWYELIPLLSFIFLRGRCSSCKNNISWQYPLVELGTGILFLLSSIYAYSYERLILSWIISSIIILIFVYDLKHKLIPDLFVILLAIFGSIYSFFFYGFSFWLTFCLLAGIILPLPFFLIWHFSDGRLMGMGDVKLMIAMGLTLGFIGGFSSILSAFFLGAIFSLLLMLISRLWHFSNRITMRSEIPFGPFLIIGFILVFFFNFNVFTLLSKIIL